MVVILYSIYAVNYITRELRANVGLNIKYLYVKNRKTVVVPIMDKIAGYLLGNVGVRLYLIGSTAVSSQQFGEKKNIKPHSLVKPPTPSLR